MLSLLRKSFLFDIRMLLLANEWTAPVIAMREAGQLCAVAL